MRRFFLCFVVFGIVNAGTLNYAQTENQVLENKRFVIGVASYNNERFFKKNLDSIFSQNYCNYRVIYSDDASTDNTLECIHDYITSKGLEDRITLRHNSINRGAMYNHYKMVHMCEDDEIYVSLDGDDWFAHKEVLSKINRVYQNEDVWVTYGNEMLLDGRLGLDRSLNFSDLRRGGHRSLPYCYAPPRTFYASLFKRIPVSYFQDNGGQFFDTSCDVAYMFPILDQARDHAYFIDQIFYIYNNDTGINDFRVIPKRQSDVEAMIRGKAPLDPIETWRNN